MKVKIKKLHKNAVIPKYAKEGDAGMDLTATSKKVNISYTTGFDSITYGTGISLEIPSGHVGLLFPRSSLSKTDLILGNHVGVIDSGYRGEVMMKFRNTDYRDYEVGDRIGQIIIMPYPQVEFEEVEELSDTSRGDGGFGSTG